MKNLLEEKRTTEGHLAHCLGEYAKLEAELAAAKNLLAKVFGKGCVFTGSVIGPISDCAMADANEPSCALTSETIPVDNTRPDWCPYLPFEEVKK